MNTHTRQSSNPRPMGRGRGWVHGVVLLGYLILTLVMTWPMAAQFLSAIPGDSFDGWQNYWNLWWVKVSLVENLQNPYATDLLYYPTGVTLYFHTLNPFNALVTLPVQLTGGLIAAYNGVVLVSWVLAGYGMWLLARWVIGRTFVAHGDSGPRLWWKDDFAAFVAGAIFTFAPVHMAHLLGHMQVMALQWLPFYVLALLRGMTRARAGKSWLADGWLAGLFLVLAGLCDWYFVLYLFLLTGVAILYAWVDALLHREWSVRAWLGVIGPAAVAGVIFAVVLAPLLGPMVYEATTFSFMVRPAADLYRYSATVVDFLLPNRIHPLFRPDSLGEWGNQVAPVSERTIGIGFGALALALVAAVTLRRKVAFWVVGVLVFVLVAMGPRMHLTTITAMDIPTDGGTTLQEWSPYAVVNRLVPFMRISRSVSRFAIVVQICMGVLAGVGLAWLLRRVQKPLAVAMGVGVLAFVLVEYWVVPYPMSPPDTPAYYETMAAQPSTGAVLNLPMNYDRPGYLLYQTVHHRPLTVAYISRVDPRTMTERVPLLQHWRHLGPDILDVDPATVGMTVLADLNVETVILDRYKMPGGLEREYTEAMANELFAGVQPTYADDRITVYTVTPPPLPTPYLSMGPLNWGPLTEADGSLYRVIGEDGALLQLHHVTSGAIVTIAYQSDADALVSSSGGDSWLLPDAPTGGTLAVELPAGVDELTFMPHLTPEGGELRITQLALDVVGE